MSEYGFEQKNQQDYDENSEVITKALLDIQSDKKIKASIAQLSKMTGIHRNTLANRIWPIQQLKKIKEERKQQAEKEKLQAKKITIDKDKQLEMVRTEAIYWFNEYQDMKRFFEHSDKRFQNMRDSRDYYKECFESEAKKHLAAKEELERIKILIEEIK